MRLQVGKALLHCYEAMWHQPAWMFTFVWAYLCIFTLVKRAVIRWVTVGKNTQNNSNGCNGSHQKIRESSKWETNKGKKFIIKDQEPYQAWFRSWNNQLIGYKCIYLKEVTGFSQGHHQTNIKGIECVSTYDKIEWVDKIQYVHVHSHSILFILVWWWPWPKPVTSFKYMRL